MMYGISNICLETFQKQIYPHQISSLELLFLFINKLLNLWVLL